MPYGVLSQSAIALRARNEHHINEIIKHANLLEVPTEGNQAQRTAIANLIGAIRTSSRQLKNCAARQPHTEG